MLSKSVGLVLGGDDKGLAYIGAIKVLEEHGIRPDIIGGNSMSAFVSACYTRDPSFVRSYKPSMTFGSGLLSKGRILMDLSYPFIYVFFSGHSFNRLIWKEFDNKKNEDLWLTML
jgi:predicted acylesterase/phospholipase RssA